MLTVVDRYTQWLEALFLANAEAVTCAKDYYMSEYHVLVYQVFLLLTKETNSLANPRKSFTKS